MEFELDADGVHFWCSSPAVTLKLVEKGARLVDEGQAEYLRRMMETGAAAEGPALQGPLPPRL